MTRIVFLNPTPKDLISGGMKTVYRQAEMLTELGFDAYVFQPDGRPEWLHTSAKVLTTSQQRPMADRDSRISGERHELGC